MNDMAAIKSMSYVDFIKEVFIDPIRTVVVVDDEFPTLDALMDAAVNDGISKWEKTNLNRALGIINFCRNNDRRWLVDIHDGQNRSAADDLVLSSHFHHSDLMVLDFHLNKLRPDDGSEAIDILRKLAGNDHFNIVIVYTKGYGAVGGEISRVVREIATGLCDFDNRFVLKEQALSKAMGLVEDWEDESRGIIERILDFVDVGFYLKISTEFYGVIPWAEVYNKPELDAFRELLLTAPKHVSSEGRLLVKWALMKHQEQLKPKLATADYGAVDLDLGAADSVNWIRTDRLFVTVISKSESPQTLPDKLLSALEKWNPEPHRLLMSRMRSEMDERGVLAEQAVLGNRFLQAGWLEEYLSTNKLERMWKVHGAFSRHWEGLGDAIRPYVAQFAERLAVHLLEEGAADVVDRWYPGLDKELIKCHLNTHVNSKSEVEGGYLTTGHVIKVKADGEVESYWLCLSPACDLVPGQKSSGWPGRLGNFMPFIAVELQVSNQGHSIENATSGDHVFLKIDGELKCFSFVPRSQSMRAANPKWEQMFASDQGRFSEGNQIVVNRILGQKLALELSGSKACVVAHLRYEYALNLLHRLGANLSRVGLDFV